jgi:hypothetical protein
MSHSMVAEPNQYSGLLTPGLCVPVPPDCQEPFPGAILGTILEEVQFGFICL